MAVSPEHKIYNLSSTSLIVTRALKKHEFEEELTQVKYLKPDWSKMPQDGGNGRRSLLSLPRALIPKRTPSPIRFGRKFKNSDSKNSGNSSADNNGGLLSVGAASSGSKSENNVSAVASGSSSGGGGIFKRSADSKRLTVAELGLFEKL